jgi:hypothetical protein
MARIHFVSDTEFFQRVKATLNVSERSVCEDVMDDLQISPESLGQMLRIQAAANLYRLLADHLKADENIPDRLMQLSSLTRVERGIDLEQLSLLRGDSAASPSFFPAEGDEAAKGKPTK